MGKRRREEDVDAEGRKVKKSRLGPKNADQQAAAEQKAFADPAKLKNKEKYSKKGNKERKKRFKHVQREFEEASAAYEEGRDIGGGSLEKEEKPEEEVDVKAETPVKKEKVAKAAEVDEKLSKKAEKKKKKREQKEREHREKEELEAKEAKKAKKVKTKESKAGEENMKAKDEEMEEFVNLEDEGEDNKEESGPKKPQRFIIFVGTAEPPTAQTTLPAWRKKWGDLLTRELERSTI
jgi:hypothetical protein